MRHALLLAWMVTAAVPAFAQDESALAAEFRREGEKIRDSCGDFDPGAIAGCTITLATVNPLHVSFGSIAPGNGVAAGPALVGHHTPNESLRLHWSADAVAAAGGSWRAGAYLNFVHTPVRPPVAVFDENASTGGEGMEVYPIYSVYAQTVSLETLQFFGLGPAPTDAAQAAWTMKQTIVGGSALVPLRSGRLGLALAGGINGRSIRTGGAPGLTDDRTFVQFTEGVRLMPSAGLRVRPLYRLTLDQFRASAASFNRWTLDLTHEFPFYRTRRPQPRDGNTPNDCSTSVDDHSCPAASRDRYGAFMLRVLTTGSKARGGDTIPFYLQPTLGGSDINGARLLTSFDDYRFRAPNLLALQASVEHSLPALRLPRNITIPFGVFVMAEQGKVASEWGDLFERLVHSYAAGLTIRAGGFPEVFLLFAWGHEGHHVTGSVNTSLLGGSSRPSLF